MAEQGVRGGADGSAYAVATWAYLLHSAGLTPADAEAATHCSAIGSATNDDAADAAGSALVSRVRALLDAEAGVPSAAGALYPTRTTHDLGSGERGERAARIRKYQFSTGLPWLAQVWERSGAGDVRAVWLLVERFTDQVHVVDPNPWDDVDEAAVLPVHDFQVRWELSGCASVSLRG
jgi:hypothetical protein